MDDEQLLMKGYMLEACIVNVEYCFYVMNICAAYLDVLFSKFNLDDRQTQKAFEAWNAARLVLEWQCEKTGWFPVGINGRNEYGKQ